MCFVYTLDVKNEKIIKKFPTPLTRRGNKIYLVGKNGRIHYVGATKQPMATRLRNGVQPNRRTGYHGYQWLKENGSHCLITWMLDNTQNTETIEAEIVYLFRKYYGQWPKYQTEIHFHQSKRKEREAAKKIFKRTQEIMRQFT
jgi:hypothetical protein